MFTIEGDPGNWQKSFQLLRHPHRTCSGSSPAMGGSERFVYVYVNNVESHVSGSHLPKDGIEVCPVVIQQSTRLVNDLGDFLDVFLENSKGVRVC
ncbi:MAG: hypothetical protein AOA65_1023 [Candidatus Bathyarchaeota archaeon BA1]|nr:MAG: hypothetical protein AOA65_1023 [Candidatus Bathyarchaeota archaeon BA1]